MRGELSLLGGELGPGPAGPAPTALLCRAVKGSWAGGYKAVGTLGRAGSGVGPRRPAREVRGRRTPLGEGGHCCHPPARQGALSSAGRSRFRCPGRESSAPRRKPRPFPRPSATGTAPRPRPAPPAGPAPPSPSARSRRLPEPGRAWRPRASGAGRGGARRRDRSGPAVTGESRVRRAGGCRDLSGCRRGGGVRVSAGGCGGGTGQASAAPFRSPQAAACLQPVSGGRASAAARPVLPRSGGQAGGGGCSRCMCRC